MAVGPTIRRSLGRLEQPASAAYRAQVGRNLIIKALAEIAGAPSFVTRVAGRREVPRAAE